MALTPAQIQALATDIQGNPTLMAFKVANNNVAVRDHYNAPNDATAEDCWKTLVPISQVGDKIVGTALAALTTAETSRLQAIIMLSPSGVNPSLTDRRAFFDNVFSGTSGDSTRAALLLLWKRKMTRAERLFGVLASGVYTLTFEGQVSSSEILQAFTLIP